MSGICGVYSPHDPSVVNSQILHKMLDAIEHRGGNGRCVFIDQEAGIAIGHVYSATFQSPEEKPSPEWVENERYVATLDGAIYNNADFVHAGQFAGYQNANADATAVANHLHQSPDQFPARLDGLFGLAAWDKKEHQLWLARDAMGTKPLYYYQQPGTGLIVFASELKGILQHPAVPRRLSQDGLLAYLTFGFLPSPVSISDGVHKVRDGEVVYVDGNGRLTSRQYWKFPPKLETHGEMAEYAPLVREQIIQTVAKHIGSAKDIGVFLSGGLDSTVLLCALKALGVPQISTFSMGIQKQVTKDPMRLLRDLRWAQRAATKFGTNHHQIIIDNDHSPNRGLATILRQLDEPILTPNTYTKYLLSVKAAEQGVTSLLSGSAAAGAFNRISPEFLQKLRGKAGESASDIEVALNSIQKNLSFEDQAALINGDSAQSKSVAIGIIEKALEGNSNSSLASMFKQVKFRLQVTEKGTAVQDRTSVLNGVELRHPYADTQLLAFASNIPGNLMGSESRDMGKAVLKEAFRDELPDGIIDREIIGYPSYYWTNGEVDYLKKRLLSPEGLERTGLLDATAVSNIVQRDVQSHKKSAGKSTWGLLMLQAWYEIHINGDDSFL